MIVAMRLLFLPVGSHGDIHPYIAIAQALKVRGHEAILVTNPYYQRVIEDAGVAFRALGDRVDLAKAAQTPGAMSGFMGSLKLMRKLVIPEIPQAAEQFERIAREIQPSGVLMHPLALAGPTICEKLAIPFACAALAPISWWNPLDRPVMAPWQHATPPVSQSRFVLWAGRKVMAWTLDGPVNRVRRTNGLRAGREHFYRVNVGGQVNLGLWSPLYRGPLSGDPPTGVITGFPFFDVVREQQGDNAELMRFLDDGEPPIIFSLGTAAVHVAGKYYEAAAEACVRLKRRGLLLIGKPEYGPRSLPAGVRAFNYAPYSTVFPRGAAIVHHGGIGTTAQALRAGRPQLVTPMAHDQFDNAARAKRLGVGLRVGHARCTPDKLEQRLSHLLGDPEFARKAAELGPRIAGERGAERAAEALERAFGPKAARA
jgi:UDP:flavonoid glycosyltransferase YjiC (YdhE family)